MTDVPTREVNLIDITRIAVDPHNARKHLTAIAELSQSLDLVGQIVPVFVRPLPAKEGEPDLLLLAGHRRLAAAKMLGWSSIAGIVVNAAPEHREALEALTENVSRVNLTTGELTDAVGRLAGLEVSDEEIRRALTLNAEEVTAAKALAGATPTIRKIAERLAEEHPLTLLQQAALVTYSDVKSDLEKITNTLGYRPEQLDHTIAQIELDRKKRAKLAELKASAGDTPLLKKFDWHGPPKEHEPIVNLLSDKGKKLNAANHKSCPGHAAMIEEMYGEPPRLTYWCTDWKANGHTVLDKPSRTLLRSAREAAPAREKAAKVDEAKVALEKANDVAWEAATAVRKEFVKQLCGRKLDNAAKTYALFSVLTMGEFWSNVDEKKAETLSLDRLFCELLKALCEGSEDAFYQGWRALGPEDKSYLRFLIGQGYVISDVEKLALG
jgi:ParB family chromosome partitioning protein